MQVIIDIPKEYVPKHQNIIDIRLHFIDGHICECDYPYKELPKVHGELKDISLFTKHPIWMENKRRTGEDDAVVLLWDILKAPTLIEADNGES